MLFVDNVVDAGSQNAARTRNAFNAKREKSSYSKFGAW